MTSDQQKAFFEEEGYLIVENLLSLTEVDECLLEIERLHHLAAELEAKNDAASHYFQREPYSKGASRQDGLPVLRKIENTRRFSKIFHNLSAHPKLVAVLQDLLGADLLLFRSTLMLKPAFYGSAHGLHQDSAYWPMKPPALITVSIALNDTMPENGCFQIIPKSHTWGIQEWGRIARDQDENLTDRNDIDLSKQIEAPLKAGSALFFHSLLVHGSGPNRSPHQRHTALYAYFPPTVRYMPQGNAPKTMTFPVISGFDGKKEFTFEAV